MCKIFSIIKPLNQIIIFKNNLVFLLLKIKKSKILNSEVITLIIYFIKFNLKVLTLENISKYFSKNFLNIIQ
ncbi:hypothetical protein CWO85_00430 [Candidatus Phytoplasma ziziphi]|uniref:Uncharacterized protein n=1 Tax=Ziziphus jujuba witches'-broom phytoplasma TaxID=135727 RepID=A0A660HLT8_ZIZJU|nr:hypothetical protein CWO85_00430 [Candidatus Phytoplasma ziziphi]